MPGPDAFARRRDRTSSHRSSPSRLDSRHPLATARPHRVAEQFPRLFHRECLVVRAGGFDEPGAARKPGRILGAINAASMSRTRTSREPIWEAYAAAGGDLSQGFGTASEFTHEIALVNEPSSAMTRLGLEIVAPLSAGANSQPPGLASFSP